MKLAGQIRIVFFLLLGAVVTFNQSPQLLSRSSAGEEPVSSGDSKPYMIAMDKIYDGIPLDLVMKFRLRQD